MPKRKSSQTAPAAPETPKTKALTGTPARPDVLTPKTAKSQPAAPDATGTPEPAQNQPIGYRNQSSSPHLTDLQALLADELSDLIVSGGRPEAVAALITAAARHANFRNFSRWLEDKPADLERAVSAAVQRDVTEWTAQLSVQHARNRRAEPADEIEPKTASERIRAQVLNTLRWRFKEFLAEGSPEDHRLLAEVLSDHNAIESRRTQFGELILARAFEEQLDTVTRCYLVVDARYREQTLDYVACLKAADARRRTEVA